ncbi:putative 2Fe-2S ferredoxin CbiW [Actinokineospora spheciospongiae]|uniref:Putative 2Fe-2S ferredoxin CbiW n=1 Tax=Actinokineospora spheciospongiae TaxID=909613 RepID=W7IJ75_9PSEU|nr:(2Fe-2S) ferredoxin domain-containing protein [Actinokineospora spheciospongiae]EWC60905.1 putative 2Fe-2S ferredoxin CbiW [Actinokineospora spheciospongiae]PWW60334.1 hypothetical protein DFQ13_107131 [Actinokineospora spheciospongiae]
MREHRLVLVGMGADAANRETDLRILAEEVGARVAYLQLGAPTLHDVLDDLAATEPGSLVRLVAVPTAGTVSPARSWLRRVAGDWVRRFPGVLAITVADRAVTGEEAGLSSPAWDTAPGHGRHVLVCHGPRCSARGAAETAEALARALRERGVGVDGVLLTHTGCLYPCNHGPVVAVASDDQWWGPVTAQGARDLVAAWAADPRSGARRPVSRPGALAEALPPPHGQG